MLAWFIAQTLPPAYHLEAKPVNRVKRGESYPVLAGYTTDANIVFTVSRDNQMRWVDLRKPKGEDVVRTAPLGELPKLVLGPAQQKQADDARKMTVAMFGSDNYYPLQGLEMLRVTGDKQFCITDRHDDFYFYSTETGLLEKKVSLKGVGEFHPSETEMTADLSCASLTDTARRVQTVYSLETGKKLFEVPRTIFDTVRLHPDGKTLLHMGGDKLTAYSIPDGTVVWTTALPDKETGMLVVSPDGAKVAYNTYDPKTGERKGSAIFDLKTKVRTPVTADLVDFGVRSFSPDSKTLLLFEPKWIHLVDVETGGHRATLEATFTELWDLVYSLWFSADSKSILLVPDPNAVSPSGVRDSPYAVYCDLSQKPGKPVKKPLKKK